MIAVIATLYAACGFAAGLVTGVVLSTAIGAVL